MPPWMILGCVGISGLGRFAVKQRIATEKSGAAGR